MLVNDPIDLLLDDDGDLVVTTDLQWSKGIPAVAQGVKIRLQTFRGEWFLDLNHGVPYWQDLLGQKFSRLRARAAFVPAIVAAPGVLELHSFEVTYDGHTRAMAVNTEIRSVFGDTVVDLEMSI